MKLTNFHLIIILALALIICPVLGICQNTREGLGMYSKQTSADKEKKREMMGDDTSDLFF